MNRSLVITALVAGLAGFSGMMAEADAATSYQGYTMASSGSNAYLYDMSGTLVKTWAASGAIKNMSYLLEDGSVMVPVSSCKGSHSGAYPSGRFQKISSDGKTILWDYTYCETGKTPGYDIEPMPNGNILIPCDNTSGTGANGTIIEVKPSGTSAGQVVWTYVIPDSLSGSSSGGMGGMGGGTYINSVSYNPDNDYVLVDMQTPVRKFVVIDHSGSGSIVMTIPVGTDRLHAAKWVTKYYIGTKTLIPDADTTAMRINNMIVVGNQDKKVLEASLATKASVKNITYSFSAHEGSVQRLPNGNTLVTSGSGKNAVELADDGTVVNTLTFSNKITALRAYRYGPDFAGVKAVIGGTSINSAMSKLNAVSKIYSYSSGIISIANSDRAKVDLKIMSVNGRTVYSASSIDKNATFSTLGLIPGAYFIEVKHSTGTLKTSLIKM